MILNHASNLGHPDRMAALHETGLLDSPREESFDRLTFIASASLRTPGALLTLVDADRQFFKSAVGLAEPWRSRRQTPLSHSFCKHVVRSGAPLLVEDAERDPLVRGSPAIDALGIRAYAGVPLRAGTAHVLGDLCVFAGEPRAWHTDEVSLLEALGAIADGEMARRRTAAGEDSGGAEAVDHARRYAEAQEAIRTREDILGVISHDLRNPLNTMRLTTSLLLDEAQERRAENVQKLELLQRACDQMNRMVQDLLDVSSLEAGRLALRTAEREVAELVDEAETMLRPLAEQKGIHLERTVEQDLPRVRMDADRVLRVISNLVGNAIKFTPRGGRVLLRVRRGGRGVRFSVCDTGPGIPADLLPHIFERYWQARPGDRRGAGLGLHIARGIVEAHGGTIRAECPPGGGALVTFTLPASPPSS